MLIYALALLVAAAVAITLLAARMKSRDAAQMLRWALGVGGVLLGLLLTVRGLAVAGVPLVGAAIGLLGVAARGGRKPRSEQSAPPIRPGAMSEREAREILGVGPEADEAEIRTAHRELMKRVHPDAGGSDALAARVQQARDVLLGD